MILRIVNKYGIAGDNIQEYARMENKKIVGRAYAIDVTGVDRETIEKLTDNLLYMLG